MICVLFDIVRGIVHILERGGSSRCCGYVLRRAADHPENTSMYTHPLGIARQDGSVSFSTATNSTRVCAVYAHTSLHAHVANRYSSCNACPDSLR